MSKVIADIEFCEKCERAGLHMCRWCSRELMRTETLWLAEWPHCRECDCICLNEAIRFTGLCHYCCGAPEFAVRFGKPA